MANRVKKTVYIVKIEDSGTQGIFDAMYGPLTDELRNNSSLNISFIYSVPLFETKCSEINPNEAVLLFVNEYIATNERLQDMVKTFVDAGGLAIFACLFPSFATPPAINAMFQKLGVPWETEDCFRTDSAIPFAITDVGRALLTEVEQEYSARALQLSKVLPEQKLYGPSENAAALFPPSLRLAYAALVMSAFGKIGKGAIAYVGDVNAEIASNRLIVALCLAKW